MTDIYNLQSSDLSQLFIVILIVVYIFYKQIALRPVKASKYVILPILLIFFALQGIDGLGMAVHKSEAQIILLASIGVVSGIVSGIITKIFRGEDGILYQKGGVATAILLICTFSLRYILTRVVSTLPEGQVFSDASISYLIMFSCQFLSRSLTVFARCPEIWELYLQERRDKEKN